MNKVKLIQSYYDMWKKRDRSKIEDIFADDVVYWASFILEIIIGLFLRSSR